MTIEYHIDDNRGVVFTRLIGDVVINDFVEHQRRLAEDDNFNANGCELIDTTDGSIGEGLGSGHSHKSQIQAPGNLMHAGRSWFQAISPMGWQMYLV